MKLPVALLTLALAGLVLSGCSLKDLFANLAMSPVEDAARQEYEQAQALAAKQAIIREKKEQYPETIELRNITDNTNFIAYAFRKITNSSIEFELEAVLPNPGKQFYEVWLRRHEGQDLIRLGTLQYNHTDDYSFRYQADRDLTGYGVVYLSREAAPDDEPETIIMTGTFSIPLSASPSAALE